MPLGSPDSRTPRREISPSDAWVLAPLIAGQPVYRTGRWIGDRFQYPRTRTPSPITKTAPRAPAAVLVHGRDGSVRTLCLDLDTSKARKAVVDDDADKLGTLFDKAGIRYLEDFSPSGGRHIYVPLKQPMAAAEARELIEALMFHAASLDPGPHQNITDGCIRVPGSAHKYGGHQVLLTPLSEAYDTLIRRNAPRAISALRQILAPEIRRLHAARQRTQRLIPDPPRTTHGTSTTPIGRHSPLRSVALTGLYDTQRYASDSEARMAVLNHFAACNWTLEQVRAGMNGTYAGLAALYGTKADRLLAPEWNKATSWVTEKRPSRARRQKNAHNYNTSPPKPTGGATNPTAASIHQLVNDLENILYAVLDQRFAQHGRLGISLKFLFRAVLAYMRTNQTNMLDVGCRTFAVALGKDHVTIARLLPVLEKATSGILTRIERGRGKNADTYIIHLPQEYETTARQLTWRKGKIHAVRPIFRVLGDLAALTYEAIERGRHSPTTAELVRTTGFSRNAVTTALSEMESLQMLRRHQGRWEIIATTNLSDLAERLGATVERQQQITRYRHERAQWHAWLDRHTDGTIVEADIYDPEAEEYWIPPCNDEDLQLSLWSAA
jgi:hypothetical protein